jgi:ArsR family transcriptional regulator, arsenate/arsenite/antimonite-responsive transcriptional repressor
MNTSIEPVSGSDYLDLKRMLKALGDVVRLNMVQVLARTDEITVTDLTQTLIQNGRLISQPLVSWHLAMLRRAGLVRTRRAGRQVYCSLDTSRYYQCLRMLGDLAGISVPATPRATTVQPDAPAGMFGASQRN